ncbi:MAG: 50S ribosomal protein L24 [Candidatus Micrarchaeaceae archaeon]
MHIQSSKPRKQRLFRAEAPVHVRKAFAHSRISKDLAKKLGIKKRSAQVRKGDIVKIMIGSKKGKTGKVNKVETKKGIILIEGISRRNAKGKELLIPIKTSNVYITDLDLNDKLRKEKLGLKE